MEKSAQFVIIATVIIAAIIIVAVLSKCLRRRAQPPAEKFTMVSPATPLLVDAMKNVTDDIRLICTYGKTFVDAAANTGAPPEAVPVLGNAVTPVRQVALILEGAASRIKATPPSWDNYAQIYRALSGSDASMCRSAQEYISAGRTAHQFVADNPGDQHTLYYTVAGNALISIGQQIRILTADVHRLGAVLDLE